MAMIKFPYQLEGEVRFESYPQVLKRINSFSNVRNIGKDESGQYDMKVIEMGNAIKPTLLVIASMHPPEWAGTQYSLSFFEMLRDRTFPDKQFRDKLLRKFHLVYIPIVNPYGYNRLPSPLSRTKGRYNVNGIDLNRDFEHFTQAETKNVKSVMDEFRPFAFLDIHLFGVEMEGTNNKNLIIGNGQSSTNILRKTIADSWRVGSDNEAVTEWPGTSTLGKGLARTYMRDISNPYTNTTLSYITEMIRPTDTNPENPLSYKQMYQYGILSIYLFFKSSMDYFYRRRQ